MLEVVVQILENMREVQGKPAIFGERRVNKFRQNKIIFTQDRYYFTSSYFIYSSLFYNCGVFSKKIKGIEKTF